MQRWPTTGERWQISDNGGTDARWNPNGRELFYLNPARELMSVRVQTAPAVQAQPPARLFQTRIAGPLGVGHRFPYAVSADGEQFLTYVNDVGAPPPSVTVIMNWPALLRSRAASRSERTN